MFFFSALCALWGPWGRRIFSSAKARFTAKVPKTRALIQSKRLQLFSVNSFFKSIHFILSYFCDMLQSEPKVVHMLGSCFLLSSTPSVWCECYTAQEPSCLLAHSGWVETVLRNMPECQGVVLTGLSPKSHRPKSWSSPHSLKIAQQAEGSLFQEKVVADLTV